METLTQHQKIVTIMLRQRNIKDWFLPQDFMQSGLPFELFVGYEAGARVAELGKLYPEMIESVRDGKYMKRRIRYDNFTTFFNSLPEDLKAVVRKEYGAPKDQGALFTMPPLTHLS
jgi:hypothetical protein